MSTPMFTADRSLYRSEGRYQFAVSGTARNGGEAVVVPQDCGIVDGILCGALIGTGTAACGALCLDGGPAACAVCWTTLLGGLYQFCHDCIPAWMRALIDEFEGGGGGGGGGGSLPRCCPIGRTCRCGGKCVTNSNGTISCVGGVCLEPNQSCP